MNIHSYKREIEKAEDCIQSQRTLINILLALFAISSGLFAINLYISSSEITKIKTDIDDYTKNKIKESIREFEKLNLKNSLTRYFKNQMYYSDSNLTSLEMLKKGKEFSESELELILSLLHEEDADQQKLFRPSKLKKGDRFEIFLAYVDILSRQKRNTVIDYFFKAIIYDKRFSAKDFKHDRPQRYILKYYLKNISIYRKDIIYILNQDYMLNGSIQSIYSFRNINLEGENEIINLIMKIISTDPKKIGTIPNNEVVINRFFDHNLHNEIFRIDVLNNRNYLKIFFENRGVASVNKDSYLIQKLIKLKMVPYKCHYLKGQGRVCHNPATKKDK